AEEALTLLEPFARGAVPPVQPWTPERKFKLVLEVLEGKVPANAACAQHGIDEKELDFWKQRFLDGARKALDPKPASRDSTVLFEAPQDGSKVLLGGPAPSTQQNSARFSDF